MQPYEEVSLLIESVEDDIARAVRSGSTALARQFAQELKARFSIYRDAYADAGIAWAISSQRTERMFASFPPKKGDSVKDSTRRTRHDNSTERRSGENRGISRQGAQ